MRGNVNKEHVNLFASKFCDGMKVQSELKGAMESGDEIPGRPRTPDYPKPLAYQGACALNIYFYISIFMLHSIFFHKRNFSKISYSWNYHFKICDYYHL